MISFNDLKKSIGCFKNLNLNFYSNDRQSSSTKIIQPTLMIIVAMVIPYLIGYSLVILIIWICWKWILYFVKIRRSHVNVSFILWKKIRPHWKIYYLLMKKRKFYEQKKLHCKWFIIQKQVTKINKCSMFNSRKNIKENYVLQGCKNF